MSAHRSRKIIKAVYLLLERYHRLYGLEAYLFSGPHGPGYVGFQIAADRCWDADSAHVDYPVDDQGRSRFGPLTTYITGHVGIPAWSAGRQLALDNWEQRRTSEIVAWLEEHLALRPLFEQNADLIQRWRTAYTVEDSEQYLLMVNVAGLLAQAVDDFPRTPSQCLSDYDTDAPEKVSQQLRRLRLSHERGTVMGISGIMIGHNGMALVNDRPIDIWQRRLAGKTPANLATWLLAQRQEG